MFKAQCHCGKVRLSSPKFPTEITRCNCSICNRLGALWAYYPENTVSIDVESLLTYTWGEKKIKFHRCGICGCTTHYSSVEDNGFAQIAINTRMSEYEQIKSIHIRDFDGADTWKYLDTQNT